MEAVLRANRYLRCKKRPLRRRRPGYSVRPAQQSDMSACNRLRGHVHGHDRGGELADAISQGTAVVAERHGHIAAYATAVGFLGHAAGQSNADLQALIASADEFVGPGILCPPETQACSAGAWSRASGSSSRRSQRRRVTPALRRTAC
jgi:hypothetical protein